MHAQALAATPVRRIKKPKSHRQTAPSKKQIWEVSQWRRQHAREANYAGLLTIQPQHNTKLVKAHDEWSFELPLLWASKMPDSGLRH